MILLYNSIMSQGVSKKVQYIVVGGFAVSVFSAAGYWVTHQEVSADTLTSNTATQLTASNVTPAVTISPEVTASPESSPSPEASTDLAGVTVPVDPTPSPIAAALTDDRATALPSTSIPTTAPQNTNNHLIILGVDAAIVLLLLLILVFRLITKLFSQPGMQQPIGSNNQKPLTIDELNIDIPA